MGEPAVKERLSATGWVAQRQLGRGQYGVAYLVEWSRPSPEGSIEEAGPARGDQAVAKVVSLECLPEKEHRTAFLEVELMRSLRHPYIVSLRDHFLTEGSLELVIVMEFCDSGDLRREVKRRSTAKPLDHFPEAQIMTWFVQLTHALNYIHERYILHRDLKSSNIFMISNSQTVGSLDVKIGDFGISRVLEGTVDVAATVVGTPYYMSPEVCRSEPYSYKSDIWALGCVLYEMCMLKHAFESQSLLGLVYKIVSETYDPIPAQYSKELRSLMDRVLDKSENTRPSGKDLLADAYVKKFASRTLPQNGRPAPDTTGQARQQQQQQQQSPQHQQQQQPPPPRMSLAQRAKAGAGRPDASPERQAKLANGEASPPGDASPCAQQVEQPTRPAWHTGHAPTAATSKPLSEAELRVAVYLRRIRRTLGIRRQNWLQVFASFDHAGNGQLPETEFEHAMTSMALGLSEQEIREVRMQLQGSAASVQVERFGEALHRAHPEVVQLEDWSRSILAQLTREAISIGGQQGGVAIGATVRVHGLQSIAGAKLNGLDGLVERWDAPTCRWVVRLSDGTLKSIRDENLQVLRAAPPKEAGSLRDTCSADTICLYRLLCADGETAVSEDHFISVVQRLLPKLGETERRRLLPMLPKSPEGKIDVPEVLAQLAVGSPINNGRQAAEPSWHPATQGLMPGLPRGQRPGPGPARAWEPMNGGAMAQQQNQQQQQQPPPQQRGGGVRSPPGVPTMIDTPVSPKNMGQAGVPGAVPSPRAQGPIDGSGSSDASCTQEGNEQIKEMVLDIGSPTAGSMKDTAQSWRKVAPPREFVSSDKAAQSLKATQATRQPETISGRICRCMRRPQD